MSFRLQVVKMNQYAKTPQRATNGSAGYDLHATIGIEIGPGEDALVPTGIAMSIPLGLCGQIWPRSGMDVNQRTTRCAGLIDPDYRGEVKVLLHNRSETNTVTIKQGDRIGQIVFVPTYAPTFDVVSELDGTIRGAGGFGHTGV